MKYRGDIDGLRAIAVLVVIAFHAGIATFSGGFIGVDVFFVISGYLITTLLSQEMQQQRFSFANFYKRRISRLLPALTLTLLVVLCMGFILYDNHGFNHLGKQTFFSALGAANLFFAAGDDYFASGVANQPLIHLWSLGVEEQFYVVWPVVLLLVYKFKPRWLLPTTLLLLLVSLIASELAAQEQTPASYFLPHYRAFELLIGALTAMLLQRYDAQRISNRTRGMLGWLGLVFIFVPIVMLDKHSIFPGVNALLPCLGTAMLIAFPSDSLLNKLLSHKAMVLIGLISYPLYLYHQPMISFLHLSTVDLAPWTLFGVVTLVTGGFAWLTYHYVETPIRHITSRGSVMNKRVTVTGLVITLPLFAVLGFGVAKTDGFPARFEWLNPYAATIDGAHRMPFHQQFEGGWQVDSPPQGKILFVGDSVMQQYVEPMALALGYEKSQIELATRGLCVMLKGVDYADQIAGISCDDLRDKLYSLDTHYQHVVISQAWQGYDAAVKNYQPDAGNLFDRWQSLVSNTIEHFQNMSDQVILVGMHPIIDGTGGIRSRVLITPEQYQERLKNLKFAHPERLEQGRSFFQQFANLAKVKVIHPEDIFCQESCVFSGEQWSYFGDSVHISTAAVPFVERRFRELLAAEEDSQGQALPSGKELQ